MTGHTQNPSSLLPRTPAHSGQQFNIDLQILTPSMPSPHHSPTKAATAQISECQLLNTGLFSFYPEEIRASLPKEWLRMDPESQGWGQMQIWSPHHSASLSLPRMVALETGRYVPISQGPMTIRVALRAPPKMEGAEN